MPGTTNRTRRPPAWIGDHRFMLRTNDTLWARRYGTTDDDGKTTVYVNQVTPQVFAGHLWFLTDFGNQGPRDMPRHVNCPAAWLA